MLSQKTGKKASKYGCPKKSPIWERTVCPTSIYKNSLFDHILSNSYSVPTAESKILNYGFTKDNIRNVYILPFQIVKEPK